MEVCRVFQSGPYTSRALLRSLKSMHLHMMQLKRKIHFCSYLVCSQIDVVFYWSSYSIWGSYDLRLDIIRQDFKSGLEALLKANPIRAIFLGVRIGDPTAVSFSSNLKIHMQIFCRTFEKFWSLWLIASRWFFFSRLVKSNSLLAPLDGLPLWGWILFWIGHIGILFLLSHIFLLLPLLVAFSTKSTVYLDWWFYESVCLTYF